nr:peritrophin-1-like [Aedes albopictus]XP_029712896.1 peritrophin-1-like [Aedes albopictus]
MSRINKSVLVVALIVTVATSATTAYFCDGLIGGTLIKWHEPEACNRFYACQHGTDHEWFCPPGEFFSQRNQQCESACDPLDTNQWCAGLPDVTFIRVPPNEPADCNKYYTCMGGIMHPQRCPAGFYFSQLHQMCGFDPTQC